MKVEFNNPELPSGMEVEVGGILLVNDQVTEVSEEQLDMFSAKNGGQDLREALSSVRFVSVDGQETYTPPAPVEAEVVSAETTGDESYEVGENT